MTTNDYERQRAENIRRNQSLLKELHLDRRPTTTRPRPSDFKFTPSKRRKLSNAPPPTRASARISAAQRPNYNEDSVQANLARQTSSPARRKLTSSKPPTRKLISADETVPWPNDHEKAALATSWTTWTPSGAEPIRDEDNTLHFSDHPDFTPNKTPKEIIQEGCFGGGYYRPIWSRTMGMTIQGDWEELPKEWIVGLDVDRFLVQGRYDPEVNKFKVACGQTIEEWEAAGWINHTYDPRGWFQWYTRFYRGRRCPDDARQISRWKKCVGPTGRWRRILLKKYVQMSIREVFDYGEGEDEEDRKEVSPVVHQTCHHWAYEVRQGDLERFWETGT